MAYTMRGFMVVCLARHSGEQTNQARRTRRTQWSSHTSMVDAVVTSRFNGNKSGSQVFYRKPFSILLPTWCTLPTEFLGSHINSQVFSHSDLSIHTRGILVSGANREVARRKNLRNDVGAEELNREGAPGGEKNRERLLIKDLIVALIAIEM